MLAYVIAYLALASAEQKSASPKCAGGMTLVANFNIDNTAWCACEDLEHPGGAILLVSAEGDAEWFEKTYEPYTQGGDEDYYLNHTKAYVMSARADVLATTLLNNYSEVTWKLVESAVPPMINVGIRCDKTLHAILF